MRSRVAALVVSAVLLASCSTTVAGTPVADPSGVPKPDIGSYADAPRTLGAVTQSFGLELEGLRLASTIPLIYEVDPAMQYRGKLTAGSLQPAAGVSALDDVSIKSVFGDVAQAQFGRTAELGTMAGANDVRPGSTASRRPVRGVTVAVVRMPSPEAAARGVSPALLADGTDYAGKPTPKKVATSIPGFASAVAYTTDYGGTTGASTIAFLAHKQYVIGVYGGFSVEQIRTFFEKQTKNLDGFAPTPLDRVTSLARDESGVARLTLAPARGDGGYSIPARVAVVEQSDVARSVKTFADAGVDVVGRGANAVYRARDEQGAKHVLDEFSTETRESYAGVVEEQVTGAPAARCFTYPSYAGSDTKVTSCFVQVGRYLAEVGSTQRTQAFQAIGASYLILQGQK